MIATLETKGRFLENIERTPSVVSFRFALQEKINFLPGQYLQLMFDPGRGDNRALNHLLSFSSSPTRDYVEVTKKLSESEFSRRLTELRPGDEVSFRGPMGRCVFRDDYRSIGFLIGGIGITPVISIVNHIVERQLPTDAVLFYSNRTESEIAFRAELESLQAASCGFRFLCTLTREEPSDDRCLRGRVGKDLVLREVSDPLERIFFIFGPPRMVETMQALCEEIGCPKEKVRVESFAGY